MESMARQSPVCLLSRRKSKEMLLVMPEAVGWDKGDRVPRKVRADLGWEVQKVGSAPGSGPCWSCPGFRLAQGHAGCWGRVEGR